MELINLYTNRILLIKILAMVLFHILLCVPLAAQVDTIHNLNIAAQSDGQNVSIRWVPSDDKTWMEANATGYELSRYTIVRNGNPVDVKKLESTKVVLNSSILPLTEAEWTSQFPNNDPANLASAALWGLDTTTVVSTNPTLADAVNNRDAMNTRFLLALLAAEQDFDVATGLGLAFVDVNTRPNSTYMYVLSLNSTQPEFDGLSTSINVEVSNIPILPSPIEVGGEGLDMACLIHWDIEAVKENYSTFNIERSIDGVNFTKINNTPFLYATGEGGETSVATYRDSLPDNTNTYYYRILGNTPFGTQGPPSAMVSVMGKPSRLNLNVTIDSVIQVNNSAIINWRVSDESLLTDVVNFYVYRSTKSDKGFEKIDNKAIPPNRVFRRDANAPKFAYYQVEAVDINDYSYLSNIVFYQEPDSIPPAIPTGITGEFLTSSLVKLDWDANSEEDFKGYRVFVSNKDESIYTQVTRNVVKEPSYTFEIDDSFLVDSIYFKVLSTDFNDNYSERSVCLPLARPDITPPSKPVLHKVTPTPAGIEVGFRFSSSADVDYHTLERKGATTGWETILNIPKSEQATYEVNLNPSAIAATCYIDTTVLGRVEYQYRFNAFDLNANVSTSKPVFVRPYDNGVRGYIENFVINVNCVPLDTVPNQGGFDLMNEILTGYFITDEIDIPLAAGLVTWNVITAADYTAIQAMTPLEAYQFLDFKKLEYWGAALLVISQLNWTYASLDQLKDFQIYRSAENSALMLYKTIGIEELDDFIYQDLDVKAGGRYFYQIIARHTDGGHSIPSKLLTVKVPNS